MKSNKNRSRSKRQSSKYIKTVKIDHFYQIRELGQGSFAKVSLGVHEFLEIKVAIKKMEKKELEGKHNNRRIQKEMNIMRCIYHSFLLDNMKSILKFPCVLLSPIKYNDSIYTETRPILFEIAFGVY